MSTRSGRMVGALTAVALVATGLVGLQSAEAAELPCLGVPASAPVLTYPEKRMYVEAQEWWVPNEGEDDSARAATDYGHVHVGACIPLVDQPMSADFRMDVRTVLHQHGGNQLDLYDLTILSKGSGFENSLDPDDDLGTFCPPGDPGEPGMHVTSTCEQWTTRTMEIDLWEDSGEQEMKLRAYAHTADSDRMLASLSFRILIDNGTNVSDYGRYDERIRGSGYYRPDDRVTDGDDAENSGYCQAHLTSRGDPAFSGQPVSGTWEPTIHVVQSSSHNSEEITNWWMTLDPNGHVDPPVLGTIVAQGDGEADGVQLSFDTTTVADGVHRVFFQSFCEGTRAAGEGDTAHDGSKNGGVLSFPLWVNNSGAPAPEPTPSPDPEPTTPPDPGAPADLDRNLVGSSQGGTAPDSSSTGVIPIPAGYRAGDLGLMCIGAGEIADGKPAPAGWEPIAEGLDPGDLSMRLFKRTLDGTEGTDVTFPTNNREVTGGIAVFRGVTPGATGDSDTTSGGILVPDLGAGPVFSCSAGESSIPNLITPADGWLELQQRGLSHEDLQLFLGIGPQGEAMHDLDHGGDDATVAVVLVEEPAPDPDPDQEEPDTEEPTDDQARIAELEAENADLRAKLDAAKAKATEILNL